MAHQLNTMNGAVQMAFTGTTPWHGLGQRVTLGADVDTWRQQAGLDYDVLSTPVQFTTPTGQLVTFPDRAVFYRSTDGHPLAVNSDGYQVHQNGEILEFFRDLTGQLGAQIHTAGAIDGGRLVWVMAKLPDMVGEVAPGDQVRTNLVLTTSVDGSMRTRGFLTAIRVVCANTLKLANAGAKIVVEQGHRSKFDGAKMKADLSAAEKSFSEFLNVGHELTRVKLASEEAKDIVRELLAGPRWEEHKRAAAALATPVQGQMDDVMASLLGGAGSGVAVEQVKEFRSPRGEGRILELFNGAGRGSQHPGSDGTAWGLLNAVTEFVDHEQGRAQDSRLTSAWYGEGDDLKERAFEKLSALAR